MAFTPGMKTLLTMKKSYRVHIINRYKKGEIKIGINLKGELISGLSYHQMFL